MGLYVNVIKETRVLIFAYGLLNADGELSQRTNAVMKSSRGFDDKYLPDVLAPIYTD